MKNILICPLDWGMGHATRVRSIAWKLHNKGHNVIVAASEPLLKVFDDSVCSRKIVFSSLRIRYSKKWPQYLVILLQAPFLLIQFLSDHYRTAKLVKRYKADILISDNRFGCFSNRAHSIYITHQLNIKVPGRSVLFARMLSSIHGWIASAYDECWIPDVPGGLAGDLTIHSHKLNTRYIGILSMLETCEEIKPEGMPDGDYYAVIISGPEPQRSVLETRLIERFKADENIYVIAGGKTRGRGQPSLKLRLTKHGAWGKEKIANDSDDVNKDIVGTLHGLPAEAYSEGRARSISDNIKYFTYLYPENIKYILGHSRGVICRAGYSTLMDLAVLGKGAIVIPTPGQTEQEYLAEELDKKGWMKMYRQSEIGKIEPGKIPEPDGFDNISKEAEVLQEKALEKMLTTLSSR